MNTTGTIYRHSLALLTDLYQLTMAYGYWKSGRADVQSVFHLFFRKNPFRGGYAIAAGLEPIIEILQDFRFDQQDLAYLASLTGNDDQPLFEPDFLSYLGKLQFNCDVDAVPEGTVVFPHEPLLRIKGPIVQCQILETLLLNTINFQTLIATRASRLAKAAGDEPVLEFGLRRAQGIDGGLAASRAAYIGGCSATSNVLAGKLYGIPVKGTHAHSWVMSFDDEAASFRAYAAAMPNNCVFLVDTFDTLEGVEKAINVGHELRSDGHEMVGIRLDSGDLAWLSIQARKLLDEAGFPEASIVASNDLDENLIEDLKTQGAKINVWGIGTKLVTAYDQPALGGVYKLSAIQQEDGTWVPKIKLSEQAIKTSNPGMLQIRRFLENDGFVADMIWNLLETPGSEPTMVDPLDPTRNRALPHAQYIDLLEPVFRDGQRVQEPQSIEVARDRAKNQLKQFYPCLLYTSPSPRD